MKLDAAIATFAEEARELLEDMERTLLEMEAGQADPDAINALFRAAHTIKGSGGLFGFDALVSFTHHVENLIDHLREGQCVMTPALSGLLLRCTDALAALTAEALGTARRSAAEREQEAILRSALAEALAEASRGAPAVPAPAASAMETWVGEDGLASVTESTAVRASASDGTWCVDVHFGPDVFRNGLDPLSFMRYLGTLGEIRVMQTLLHTAPTLPEFDGETCHLHCHVELHGTLQAAQIEAAFDFVRDDCTLLITAPAGAEQDTAIAAIAPVPMSGSTPEPAAEPAPAPADRDTVHPAQRDAAALSANEPEPDGTPGKPRPDTRNGETRFLRVEADKLDQLINLIGELVIAGASCNLLAGRARNAELSEATSTVNALVESIRDTALNLRMVQIGATFSRFHRVVRDLSQELGKDITLQVSGADTELDKSVVERIADPLMHLVRNALDHGIESPAVRLAAGKPATGTLQLHAYHESGNIVIEVADDGGGLNVERIRAKAIERGLISDTANLSERDIHALIFAPGFSTAAAITNVSGRGVGMDVVKRNIESLRGSIEVESVLHRGTRLRIRLPLTLAIIDGFLVGVGGASYVVPLSMVVECVELRSEDISASHGRNFINLRGEVLPFVRLRALFEKDAQAGRRENIVVVRYAGHTAGLVVDELLGDFQTVIKPLGKLFGTVRGISGSTILGSGEVALILDVASLIQLAAQKEGQSLSAVARY